MLETKQLVKKFRKREVLHSLDTKFEPGVYGFLGPNGAGKTTFVRCVLGIYRFKGEVYWDGKPVSRDNDISKTLGYLPQKFGMYKELKLHDAMEYMAVVKGVPNDILEAEITRCLELVNLTDRANDRVGSLSGGMVRRFGIAQALLGDPRIIIVDEPTAGLDPEERMRFKNVINKIKKDKIVIVSTHIISDVEALCDKIIVIHEGNILSVATLEETAAIADNKVFEVESSHILDRDNNFVLKTFEREGKEFQRFFSSNPPEFAISVSPTIEDGYMCAVKGY